MRTRMRRSLCIHELSELLYMFLSLCIARGTHSLWGERRGRGRGVGRAFSYLTASSRSRRPVPRPQVDFNFSYVLWQRTFGRSCIGAVSQTALCPIRSSTSDAAAAAASPHTPVGVGAPSTHSSAAAAALPIPRRSHLVKRVRFVSSTHHRAHTAEIIMKHEKQIHIQAVMRARRCVGALTLCAVDG